MGKRIYKARKRRRVVLMKEPEINQFFQDHAGEIKGLYHDTYYKDGSWNGLMGAISEVEKRYGVTIDAENVSEQAFVKMIDAI